MNHQDFIAQSDYLKIYTDGGYEARQDKGGWGVVFTNQTAEQITLHGHASQTSSLEMELTAAVKALEWLAQTPYPQQIDLFTDSKILIEGLGGKIARYRRQNWLHLSGRPVASRLLWEKLELLTQQMRINVHWIKGHARHAGNLQADQLARQARLKEHVAL
ncbi:ribonuclease H family protein [Thiomicrorhabdus cannonii]|uniref:ribonuclease H family protein n=1 Tax=Thiomicrorhabdus cannonii TaxID=2748011 RepID=UPI0015B7958B|nr:ribonuclease H [Thiomicrorhabdus cannonii]